MRQAFHALIIATSAFAVTACIDSQEQSAASADDNAPGEAVVAATGADDGWVTDDATDIEAVGIMVTCQKIYFPGTHCPVGSRCGVPDTSAIECPRGFTCLYQNVDRTGFAVGVSSGCRIRNLRSIPCPTCINGAQGNDGTFNDQMSSWQNANGDGRESCWWFDIGQGGGPPIRMPDHTIHSQVLPVNNDQASEFGACE